MVDDIPVDVEVAIIGKRSTLALELECNSSENGIRILQGGWNNSSTQCFLLERQDDNFFIIRNSYSKLALGVNSGERRIVQMENNYSLWKILKKEDYYIIQLKDKDKCLDITSGSCDEGMECILWDMHCGDNQLFRFVKREELPSSVILRKWEDRFNIGIKRRFNKQEKCLKKGALGKFLGGLPYDIIPIIFSFFSMEEISKLHSICKCLHYILPKYFIARIKNWGASGDYNDEEKFLVKGPKVTSNICRVIAKIQWRDQGWGNKKGQLNIRLFHKGNQIERRDLFGIADHQMETVHADLSNQRIIYGAPKGSSYEIWRYVGGGGGHSLKIQKFWIIFEMFPN